MDIQAQGRTYSHDTSTPSLGSTQVTSSLSPSDYTTTTASTVPGLGEITGKAIIAIGRATLRGAEYVITRRRLDIISARFPHRDTDAILGIDQMYKDILEFSRRDLYHNTIRVRALVIILVQIGSHQTQKLAEHLLKWPFIEIKIFLSELTAMLDPLKLYSARVTGELPVPVQAYTKSLATWESHSLEPFIVFLQYIANENNLAIRAILEGGTSDYLLRLYISNFSDSLAEKDAADFSRTSTLYAGCNSLLWILSGTHRGLTLICGHPFHVLWSNQPDLPFTPLALNRIVQRAQIWGPMGRELILRRIRSIMEMLVDWRRPYEQEFLMDIVVDVLDFSGSESSEPDIFIRALGLFHWLICKDKLSTQSAICQYLALSTPEYFVKLMSRIISRISYLTIPGTPEWDIFVSPWDEPQFNPLDESFKLNAVFRIVDSFIEAARSDVGFLAVILEANILGLLRPLLQQEFQETPYLAQHGSDRLMVYDPVDFEFLAMIREHGLRKLYPLAPDKDPYFIDPRRTILSRAFDVVLRRKQDTDDAETRRLFWAIDLNED